MFSLYLHPCPYCDTNGHCTFGCAEGPQDLDLDFKATPTPKKSSTPLSEALREPQRQLRMKVGDKYWFYHADDPLKRRDVECIWIGEMNGELTAICLRQTLSGDRVCLERYDPETGLSREQQHRSPLQGLEQVPTPSLEWV